VEQTLETKSTSVIDQAEALAVIDQESYEVASAQVGALNELEKQIKGFYGPKKKAAKAPYDALVAEEKDLLAKPGTAKGILKGKMSAHFKKQEAKRREEEQRLRELAKEEGIDTEADGALLAAPKMEQPSGVTQRKVWKFRVVDADKIPKEYFLLDEKRIGMEVRAGHDKVNIPGIEAYCDYTTVVK